MASYQTPTGLAIVAVKVLTPGLCGISGFDDDGNPEFDGSGTEHIYDDQEVATVPAGAGVEGVCIASDGSEWPFGKLVKVEPELVEHYRGYGIWREGNWFCWFAPAGRPGRSADEWDTIEEARASIDDELAPPDADERRALGIPDQDDTPSLPLPGWITER